MKFLVIDDDDAVRYTVAKILRRHGHDVASAADGKRGIALVEDERPHVVVTDIIMPEQEGIETIIQLRRENPEIKIIAISGGFRTYNYDVLSIARNLGADDILPKPFEADDLMRSVDRVIAGPPPRRR
jgi:CheY-like chemotaxis protein